MLGIATPNEVTSGRLSILACKRSADSWASGPRQGFDLEDPACGPPAFARPRRSTLEVDLLRKRTSHTPPTTLSPYAHPLYRVPLEIVSARRYLPRIGPKGTNVNTTPQPASPPRGSHESIASQHGSRTANEDQAGLQGHQHYQLKTKGTDASPLKNRFVPFSSGTALRCSLSCLSGLTHRRCHFFSWFFTVHVACFSPCLFVSLAGLFVQPSGF